MKNLLFILILTLVSIAANAQSFVFNTILVAPKEHRDTFYTQSQDTIGLISLKKGLISIDSETYWFDRVLNKYVQLSTGELVTIVVTKYRKKVELISIDTKYCVYLYTSLKKFKN